MLYMFCLLSLLVLVLVCVNSDVLHIDATAYTYTRMYTLIPFSINRCFLQTCVFALEF